MSIELSLLVQAFCDDCGLMYPSTSHYRLTTQERGGVIKYTSLYAAPYILHPPIVPSFRCRCFNRFSVLMNSRIPTGIPRNKSPPPSPVPQLVSLPPPSSSMLEPLSVPLYWTLAVRASLLFAAHSSSSSRYWSQTQLTQPDIQQLSGSRGRGGTSTPAIKVDLLSISARRSPGPASRDPKTTLAFWIRSSFSVLGDDSCDGDVALGGLAGFVRL